VNAGTYALAGVVLGGVVTSASQIGVGWWQARRTGRAEWLVASRLVSEELERMMLDLRGLIESAVVPPFALDESFLDTSAWDEYRAVIARELQDDPAGDEVWRGLARITATTRHGLRMVLRMLPPGSALPSVLLVALHDGFDAAGGAYEALTGVAPQVALDSTSTGAPGDDAAKMS
jgi:hypothetical protein